jgi:hypothetical protein
MMKLYAKAAVFGVIAILCGSGCERQPSNPSQDGASFQLNIHYLEHPDPGAAGLFFPRHNGAASSVPKALGSLTIDEARVCVIDLSKYRSMEEVTHSDEYRAYSQDAAQFTNFQVWGEWVKLIGAHFPIAVDQALQREGGFFTGKVAGGAGLNDIGVALIEQGKLHYLGEAIALGKEEGTQPINIGVFDVSGLNPDTGSTAPLSIKVTPGSDTLYFGGTLQFECTATYPNDLTLSVTVLADWSNSPGIAGLVDNYGFFTADASHTGVETVTASYEGLQDQAIITVIAPPP